MGRHMKRIVGLVLALAVLGGVGRADDYPSRPVKLVLPQPPGGAVDLIARTLGDRLAEQLRQPVSSRTCRAEMDRWRRELWHVPRRTVTRC